MFGYIYIFCSLPFSALYRSHFIVSFQSGAEFVRVFQIET